MALTIPQPVIDRLAAYDTALESIGEIELSGELLAALPAPESLTAAERKGANAELSAFRFSSRHGASSGRWGIYWRELTSAVLQDGTEFLSPDVAEIDEEILSYWTARSQQVKHPVLKARYADLVWEIGRFLRVQAKREGVEPGPAIPVTLCHTAVDSYLEVVESNLFKDEYRAWTYLGRALELALRLRDTTRIGQIKEALFDLYRRLDASTPQWTWWKFDELVWTHAKGLELDAKERLTVVDLLERVLTSCSDSSDAKNFDPHSATSAADCLQRWRAQSNELAEARRAVGTAALAFEEAAKLAGGMTAISWLEDLIPRYRQAGMMEDAARVEQTIRQRATDAQAEMKTVEASMEIDPAELEQFVAQFLKGSMADALTRVAGQFILKEEATKTSLRDMCTEAPLLSMMPSTIVNGEGFTTATVGSIEDDLDGRALQHAATMFSWKAPWLHLVLNRVRQKYDIDADGLTALIQQCPSFAPERMSLMRDGVAAWLAGDSVKAIHVLVPQIEGALRALLSALGGAVVVPDQDVGGFKAIGLGPILTHPIFLEKVPRDIRFHLRALYNDPRGLNLRNELAHGLVRPELLNMGLANWVMHTVILLSLLRVNRA
ncbi:DUF4209 domain-containing protein [Pandoraea terrigena]|uniref:Uncharacterized protein n=1 Tax=Pandoraea terrigena TaxID=2508292 RepID=A0A5E4USC8_9BURK|nr:DUF4209 domain-containing protein [Pandoraea terrigena]VVE01805.1 hypothetical protein PTE31013_02183 [Pandoraea terrigena]